MNYLFYDTSALLDFEDFIFHEEDKILISNLTINELEKIKSSSIKDPGIKYKVRQVLRFLQNNSDKYEIVIYRTSYSDWLNDFNLPENNDSKIIISAYCYFKDRDITNDFGIFYSTDLACSTIAKSIGLNVNYTREIKEEYTGFKELVFSEEDLEKFYSNYYPNNINYFNLLNNEYLLIKDINNKIIDKYKWTNDKYCPIIFQKLESKMFGKVTPKYGDPYQQIAIDSLNSNQITVFRGAAGTGKSLLGLAYMFQELEKGRIDKIIMFVNPVATKDSCKFGFLPGDAIDKILGSQIGHFLSSKLGDLYIVEKLIEENKLDLIPMADCRGFDSSGLNAGIYITEAQNTTKEMMKLILQRIGDDSICVIEGDDMAQVDMNSYEGNNNGLKRLSEVFRGQDYYGEITLKNCYRSKIAKQAEKL